MSVSEQQHAARDSGSPSGRNRPSGRGRPDGRQRARQGGSIAAQPWPDNVFTQPTRQRYSPYALALTLFVHLAPLLLILLVPEVLVPAEQKPQKPNTKVELVPPPFVQVNPFANQERVRTEQEGAQNQRAAQEADPDPSSRAQGPQLDGEDPRFKRIISGNPEAPDVAPAPLLATGDSDSVTPPAAGSSAGGSVQLQTRAEYLREQAATAQAAATQSATAQPSPLQPTATLTQIDGQQTSPPQPAATPTQQPTSTQQASRAQQPATTGDPITSPSTTAQQTPSPLRPQPAAVAQQQLTDNQAPTSTAKPPEQLTDEGMAPADLPTDELSPPALSQTQPTLPPTDAPRPADAPAVAPETAEPPQQPQAPETQQQPQVPEAAQPPAPEPAPQPTPQPSAESAQESTQPAASATQGSEDSPAIDPSAPRPRPTLEPRISAGPLRDQSVMSNQRGLVAIDSRFSEFGAYQQRMIEVISNQWYILARQSKAIDSEYGTQVVLVFTMDDGGVISNTQVRFTNASAAATLLCINAVESRSPFGPWTADMKRVLGQSQTVTFTFYYR